MLWTLGLRLLRLNKLLGGFQRYWIHIWVTIFEIQSSEFNLEDVTLTNYIISLFAELENNQRRGGENWFPTFVFFFCFRSFFEVFSVKIILQFFFNYSCKLSKVYINIWVLIDSLIELSKWNPKDFSSCVIPNFIIHYICCHKFAINLKCFVNPLLFFRNLTIFVSLF